MAVPLFEQHTEVGGKARTLSVGRVYERNLKTMSQTGMMRPEKGDGWPAIQYSRLRVQCREDV